MYAVQMQYSNVTRVQILTMIASKDGMNTRVVYSNMKNFKCYEHEYIEILYSQPSIRKDVM